MIVAAIAVRVGNGAVRSWNGMERDEGAAPL
jgi:hypothetical protein